jgi:acyl-CoA thioesterase FadM
VEVAQFEYYRNLGIRIYDEKSREYFDTATVKATLEFKSPVHVDDLIDVYLRVTSIGSTSITTNAEIYRNGEDELLFEAEVIAVDYDSSKGAKRVVPDGIRTLINHFEETGEVLSLNTFPDSSAQ